MTNHKFLYTDDEGMYTEGIIEGNSLQRSCDSSANIGDFVTQSLLLINSVDVASDNSSVRSVIGQIVDKPTTTEAVIMTKGVITGLAGMIKTQKVYLGSDGKLTPDLPESGYLHILGQAIDEDKVDFYPINTKIKLSTPPFEGIVFPVSEQQELLSSDIKAHDLFGYCVSISGDTCIVGAYIQNTNGTEAGAAYVFTRTGTTWTQQQKLLPSDPSAYDHFGMSVVIEGDTCIIGTPYYDDNGGSDSNCGAAYVFTRTGTTWTQQQKIQASDFSSVALFGYSVDIDGDNCIIGAKDENDIVNDSGAAYVFTKPGSTWVEQQKLKAPDPGNKNYFGCSVSISGDSCIVGEYQGNDGNVNSGAAYAFNRTGTTWTQQQKLLPSDPSAYGYYGISVSIYNNTCVIGSWGVDTGAGNAGAAYIYNKVGVVWSEEQKIQASDLQLQDKFGISVSIDLDTCIVGAYNEDTGGSNAGAAYIFNKTGSVWVEEQKIQAISTNADDYFGFSVCIDGSSCIVGAYHSEVGASDGGAAYIFT